MVIFVSSPGRSGTRFLAQLFAHCTALPSFHYKEPICHAQVMIDANSGQNPPEILQKADIVSQIASTHGGYFESSQVFVRVLAPWFLNFFPDLAVIHLLRDPLEVAKSYVNRESYPSHPNRPWRLPLNLPASMLKAPENLTPLQENLCDWLENELRFHTLRPRIRNTFVLYFTDLDDQFTISTMFQELGVAFDRSSLSAHLSARDLDQNANKVKTSLSETDLAEADSLIHQLVDSGFDSSVFQASVYTSFPFIQNLLNAT